LSLRFTAANLLHLEYPVNLKYIVNAVKMPVFKNAVPGAFGDLTGTSPKDPAALIHDLRAHQIELKMQNEELRRLQQELENTRD